MILLGSLTFNAQSITSMTCLLTGFTEFGQQYWLKLSISQSLNINSINKQLDFTSKDLGSQGSCDHRQQFQWVKLLKYVRLEILDCCLLCFSTLKGLEVVLEAIEYHNFFDKPKGSHNPSASTALQTKTGISWHLYTYSLVYDYFWA